MPEFLQALLASPWLYAVVLALAALDAFLPFTPSDSTVIAISVAAATGPPSIWLVLLAAVAGVLLGDYATYLAGRGAGPGLERRISRSAKGKQVYDWARRSMERRGPWVIVVARYVPAGRLASMLAAGAVRYPRGRFLLWDTVAGTIWAVACVSLGYLGGRAFEQNPLLGLVLALGIAAAVAGAVAGVRALSRRRRDTPRPELAGLSEAGTAR
ncbi:DedA family protein [Crossiella sp. SN42]|uniref:DedA family protein n=1 Tax=Crossiella sp. SN42 TaxID=2944808 RepID=UPI00207C68F5|nr:DedA family protein [Crossiella sp. SN42]MCO1577987.1 DedA family protein [Crossiella sp. SN42]